MDKITLFTKKDKPSVKEVIGYLRKHFKNLIIYEGHVGDVFPERAKTCRQDIIISYLSPWIIPVDVLNKTKLWNINFHPGPPEYPGIGCTNFAIYNNERTYGVVAHLMVEKVDTGKIIAVKRFPLSPDDSVASLTEISYRYMFFLFRRVMDFILKNNRLPECNENWKRVPYTREELEELCEIDPYMSREEVKKRIRATTYPGRPSSYIRLQGHIFEFNPNRQYQARKKYFNRGVKKGQAKEKIIIVGGGGHAKVIINLLKKINEYDILGYVDIENRKRILGVDYLGDDDALEDIIRKNPGCSALIGIGNLTISEKRKELKDKLEKLRFKLPIIVSPEAIVNESVKLSPGTIIFDKVVVNPGTKIGECVILNTNCVVEHDCLIGDFVHIAPGAILSGGVKIGENTLIGAGATIIQYRKITKNCIIGAGAVVIRDCNSESVYVGVPAVATKK